MRLRLLLASIAWTLLADVAAAQTVSRRILVMPFENSSRDQRTVWLGEAASLLVAEELNDLGASAITRDQRRQAFAHLQVPSTASLTGATVIRIAQLAGASFVVTGAVHLEGDAVVASARILELSSARIRASATERAQASEIFELFAKLAASLAPVSSPAPTPMPTADSRRKARPGVSVFENYVKGLVAETPAAALASLEAALQAQPDFDRARLAMWDVYDEQEQHDRALAVVARVGRSSELWARARFLAGLSQLQLQRYDEAFQTFQALVNLAPTPAVLNNLGVVQLHRATSSASDSAAAYFNRAAEADPSDPDFFFNLGYAEWSARNPQAASHWLREAVRRDPADGDAHYVLAAALTASGNATEATRERELARRLSSVYEEWEQKSGAGSVPRELERIKRDVALPGEERIEVAIASAGQRDQQELARFYLDRGRRLFQQEDDREALVELNRALFLLPYQAEAHLLVGRIHLRGGRPRDAIGAFKISLWSNETADAHGWLGEAHLEAGDADAARAEVARALALDPVNERARAVQSRLTSR